MRTFKEGPEALSERMRRAALTRWSADTSRVTVADLERVKGLSLPMQAEALGCSQSTVSRLRRAARETASLDDRVSRLEAVVFAGEQA